MRIVVANKIKQNLKNTNLKIRSKAFKSIALALAHVAYYLSTQKRFQTCPCETSLKK